MAQPWMFMTMMMMTVTQKQLTWKFSFRRCGREVKIIFFKLTAKSKLVSEYTIFQKLVFTLKNPLLYVASNSPFDNRLYICMGSLCFSGNTADYFPNSFN
jgi:hypothetical protein